jgi:hypothetical protein
MFALGQLLATPGALAAFARTSDDPVDYLVRHVSRDWGTVDAEDWRANDQALIDGTRLLSAYTLHDGSKIWIITEADRSVTTILLPEEY